MPTERDLPAVDLASNRYGKSRVRLLKVDRSPHITNLLDWTLELLLEGNFDRAFTAPDNTGILSTDTMKNTVYVLARQSTATTMEAFATELGAHFLTRNPAVTAASITIESALWKRLEFDGEPDPFSFMRGNDERQFTTVRTTRDTAPIITSGLRDLVLLKTTRSAFSGFLRDEFTTLPDAPDRLMGTAVQASWTYTTPPADFDTTRSNLRESMLQTFAGHDSQSVQHTLFDMGRAALGATPEIDAIDLLLPNRHCLLVDLARFGLTNPNQIFVPTDEPHGTIEARVQRRQDTPA